MSALETREQQNNQYLAASLEWLRIRVQKLIGDAPPAPARPQPAAPAEPPPAAPAPSIATDPGRFARWLGSKPAAVAAPAKPTLMLPAAAGTMEVPEPAKPSLDEAAAAKAREAAAQIDPPPQLLVLAKRLGLSDFERDALLLAAAVEFDPGLPALLSRIHGSPTRDYPTFGIALNLFDGATWDAVAAHRPLRADRLVDIIQPGATPLTSSALRADERIVNYLKGLNVLDDRLSPLVIEVPDMKVSDTQQAAVDIVLDRLHDAIQKSPQADTLPVVQLSGVDPGSKLAVAQVASANLGRQLFRVNAESLPQQVAEIETLGKLWQRESVLLPVALFIDASNVDGNADLHAALVRLLSRGLGLVFVSVRDAPLKLSTPAFLVEVRKPTPAEQVAAWETALDTDDHNAATAQAIEQASAMLAGQYDLNLSEIADASAVARLATTASLEDNAWTAARDLTTPRLDALAQRLEVKSTWDDLVLPDEQTTLLRGIAGQVRERHQVYDTWGFAERMNRGFGITALFAGESGTGKTMAAEVIANDLALNLYRIDLSAVVSKYIGETEKNLRKLFDAAEQGGAILFFDEADALFGKRSEVKDSHDRYANIEINYLLQRMESFRGLAILATNQKTALDPAFMRRLRFVVNFQFPGPKERRAIWEKALPEAVPKSDLNFERLAKLSLSGGNIHSIALNAAFLAAQNERQQVVTMPLLMTAARMELRKLEKPFSESEFRV